MADGEYRLVMIAGSVLSDPQIAILTPILSVSLPRRLSKRLYDSMNRQS